jgi:hypothetical protein
VETLIPLRAGFELNDTAWAALLAAIEAGGVDVELDLSACTAGTHTAGGGLYADNAFDPNAADTHSGRIAAKGRIVSLVLPAGTVTIPDGTDTDPTFKHFGKLASVSGANLFTIGEFAFYEYTALTTVSFPEAATIGNSAFTYCTALASVNIPKVTTIGVSAFHGCAALSSVSLPKVITIGDGAFSHCTALTTVSFGPFLTTITGLAFGNCPNLRSITVDAGNSFYTVSGRMLLNNTGNKLVAYPTAVGAVTLPAAITAIDDGAFFYCFAITSVNLPAAMSIGDQAFNSCTALTTVNLPNATTIDDNAFINCYALTTVNLDSATTIGAAAFASAMALTTLSLPAATSIDFQAFHYCTALTTLYLPAAPPTLMGMLGPFDGTNTGAGAGTTLTIRVPTGKVPDYTSAWSVAAITAANGDTATYGTDHKAITITDAP